MGIWKMQLVDPSGKVWEMGEMGRASSTPVTSYVLEKVKEYLESDACDWMGKEFVLADVWQTLLNEDFFNYHNFRLVWGPIPERHVEHFRQYPNGIDVEWHLCYQSNGRVQECFSGSLPEGWWELPEEERDHQLQNVL